nr:MAG TPA: hypothetical protein [Caudoviricetes sp.]
MYARQTAGSRSIRHGPLPLRERKSPRGNVGEAKQLHEKGYTMSAMIPPDIVRDGVAYWKADKVSAYFGGSPTVGTLGVWRYRGEGPRFVKLGCKREHRQRDTRRVVYPVREVIAWGERNGLQQQTVAA